MSASKDRLYKAVGSNAIELTDEEVSRLALAAQAGDVGARDKVVRSHMKWVMKRVHKVMDRMNACGKALRDDCFQQAILELTEAVLRYDPSVGTKFVTLVWKRVDAVITAVVSGTRRSVYFPGSERVRRLSRAARDADWAEATAAARGDEMSGTDVANHYGCNDVELEGFRYGTEAVEEGSALVPAPEVSENPARAFLAELCENVPEDELLAALLVADEPSASRLESDANRMGMTVSELKATARRGRRKLRAAAKNGGEPLAQTVRERLED